MRVPPNAVHHLAIPRSDLISSIQFVSVWMGKWARSVTLSFESGSLVIEAGESMMKVSARGEWPEPIMTDASWVRVIAKNMPEGNPIRLCVQDGKLSTNKFSVPCVLASEGLPPIPEPPEPDEKRLILEAVQTLKPLLLTQKDVEKMVSEARARGSSTWFHHDKKMIAIVARAWKLLAPLGVETGDIRRFVDDAVRNAWK
jgi:hypothetical protein